MDKNQDLGRRASPPNSHLNDEGKGCSGDFVFNKEGPLPWERVCKMCGRKESYETDFIVIVGKSGVSKEQMKECARGIPKSEAVILEVASPAVAVLKIPGIGRSSQPEEYLIGILQKIGAKELQRFKERVEFAYRIPIAHDRHGNRVDY